MDYVGDDCIVATGNTLRRWAYEYSDDDGTPIECKIISRQFITPYKFITKYFDTKEAVKLTSQDSPWQFVHNGISCIFPVRNRLAKLSFARKDLARIRII